MQENYTCVLAFNNDHPSFAHGVEFGIIWEQLSRGSEELVERTVHVENREVLQRAAAVQGYSYSENVIEDGWMVVTFVKQEETPRLAM